MSSGLEDEVGSKRERRPSLGRLVGGIALVSCFLVQESRLVLVAATYLLYPGTMVWLSNSGRLARIARDRPTVAQLALVALAGLSFAVACLLTGWPIYFLMTDLPDEISVIWFMGAIVRMLILAPTILASFVVWMIPAVSAKGASLSMTIVVASMVVALLSADEFREAVAPILETRCVRCHNQANQKGHLALDTADAVLAERPRGPVIVRGKPDASYLVELISGPKPEMPRGSPPLSALEVSVIRDWIASGAKWPEGLTLRDPDAPPDPWWWNGTVRTWVIPGVAVAAILPAAYILVSRSRKRWKTT